MKSKEQIEIAQKTIKELQDYVELAKVQRKIKDIERINTLEKMLEEAKSNIKGASNDI